MDVTRKLRAGQRAELLVADLPSGRLRPVYASDRMLFEAPNWSPDGRWLLVNADGGLYRLPADGSGEPEPVDLGGVADINNDHVLAPDGTCLYVSAADGHIHRVDLSGGAARRVTDDKPAHRAFRHYLHGISPDGGTLAYVGTERVGGDDGGLRRLYTRALPDGPDRLVGDGFSPADGPEFDPSGRWLYFNSEIGSARPGHAQLFRARPDGSQPAQLTDDERVNWFPHPSPDGRRLAYVSFPPGTLGHPGNVQVTVRVAAPDGSAPTDIAGVFGGQGTLNVNSWAPDSTRFALVAYPPAD